jgi:hypothetical protein
MYRLALCFLLVPVVAGCQGDEARYDLSAKAKARAVAPTIASYGKLVAVGPARERPECSEARPFVAGPCLDVVVKRHIPGIDRRGRTVTVTNRTHVFTWLERRRGDWIVTNTAQWNPDLVVTIEDGAADLPGVPLGLPGF